jgi:hypothetical protein
MFTLLATLCTEEDKFHEADQRAFLKHASIVFVRDDGATFGSSGFLLPVPCWLDNNFVLSSCAAFGSSGFLLPVPCWLDCNVVRFDESPFPLFLSVSAADNWNPTNPDARTMLPLRKVV